MLRMFNQERRDRYRKTYLLNFPMDLDADRIVAWLRTVSGTLGAGGMGGSPTVVFEMWATNKGIAHRLKVPWQHADYVIGQLRSLIPGIRVSPVEKHERRVWVRAVEVGLSQSARQLQIYSTKDTAASLLAAVQALEENECVMVQWVAAPMRRQHKPIHKESRSHQLTYRTLLSDSEASRDEIQDRRGKLDEPNMLAVLRVASVASTHTRAEHLIGRVRMALVSTSGPATHFKKRWVPRQELQRRLDAANGSSVFPIQVSVPELSALIAWPVGSPFVSGLAPTMSRHLPPVEAIPRDGRILGIGNMPGAERPIALSYPNALRHVHVLGPTGVGKTTLLTNMAVQDMENDYGLILIDSKSEDSLYEAVLDRIPEKRLKDVIIVDVEDTKWPVGLNILDQGNSRSAIDELGNLVSRLYKDSSSIYAPQVLFHMLRALAGVEGMSFIDLPTMLSPQSPEEVAWQRSIAQQVRDPEIRLFLQRYLGQKQAEQDRMSAPVHNRTWQFTSRSEIRNILGQSKSSFQMTDVIRDNKILLVYLNSTRVGTGTASIAGTLIMNAIWQAVRSVKSEKSTFLYLDEFQDFVNLPVDASDMLAKSRSSGLGMVLAHQHLGQLSLDLRDAVLANSGTKVVFQTTSSDARSMTREFGRSVDDSDFLSLGRFEVLSRIATDIGTSPPVTLATKPESAKTGHALAVREMSRKKYGRPVAEVEAEIEQRRQAPKRRRPDIGTSESNASWG